MRISDGSSDVCSSELPVVQERIDLEEAGGSRAETIEFTGGVELDEVFVDERLQYPETSARAQARRARNRVDALPGMGREMPQNRNCVDDGCYRQNSLQLCEGPARDRKSTRLNSSH